MANTYANEVAGFGTTPETKTDGGIHGGRLRRFRASFTMASQASGDTITLARIPAGYRFAFGIINASATMGASATVAIGISGATGKYRTAAVFTAAAPTLFGNSAAADDDALTAEETVLLTVAVAALPGSGTAYVDLYYSAP
jgi:hypothetical protein